MNLLGIIRVYSWKRSTRAFLKRARRGSVAGHQAVNELISLTGVNDEIQHIGESSYVEYTRKRID
jgi:hypothetical protein